MVDSDIYGLCGSFEVCVGKVALYRNEELMFFSHFLVFQNSKNKNLKTYMVNLLFTKIVLPVIPYSRFGEKQMSALLYDGYNTH